MLAQKLRQMRDDCGLTNKELSERSGVPASSVSRILSNEAESANFQNVCAMVKAMGGSMDELMGISSLETAADKQKFNGEAKNRCPRVRSLRRTQTGKAAENGF